LEANTDQEETYAEDGEAVTAEGHSLLFLMNSVLVPTRSFMYVYSKYEKHLDF
jgi:hypothetical protein